MIYIVQQLLFNQGGKMNAKPFFVLLVFILFIAVFASGAIGSANLTNTGAAASSGSSDNINYDVFGSGASNGPSAAGAKSSVSGAANVSASSSPCGSAYTVRAGDTLSAIARACQVTLSQILAVNPAITNPNIISIGQKITIYKAPAGPTSTKTAKPAAAGAKSATPKPTNKPKPTNTLEPVEGIKVGQTVNFEVSGLPPNTNVEYGLGRVGTNVLVIAGGKTDGRGVFKVTLSVPKDARVKDKWTLYVTTIKRPQVKVTAVPFTIGR